MSKVINDRITTTIPTKLCVDDFNQYILPYLSSGSRGPKTKISSFKTFHYIMKVLHSGMQWTELTIERDKEGSPEISVTRIFRRYSQWCKDGSFENIFTQSVVELSKCSKIDVSIVHGDDTSTMAKKGGNNLGYSGHKHFIGEKTVAFVDRNCNVLSPFTTAPGNKNEFTLLPDAFSHLKRISKIANFSLAGSIVSLDGVYDSANNRKLIFNSKMKPNIPENKRNRKSKKPGPKRHFNSDIFQERFQTVERVFAWEDKFKRLLMRFERISNHHFGFKLLAYAMINLRTLVRPTL